MPRFTPIILNHWQKAGHCPGLFLEPPLRTGWGKRLSGYTGAGSSVGHARLRAWQIHRQRTGAAHHSYFGEPDHSDAHDNTAQIAKFAMELPGKIFFASLIGIRGCQSGPGTPNFTAL